jgi:hypothetical protein
MKIMVGFEDGAWAVMGGVSHSLTVLRTIKQKQRIGCLTANRGSTCAGSG